MILFGNYLDFSVEIAEVKSFFVPKSVSFFKGETIDFFPKRGIEPTKQGFNYAIHQTGFFCARSSVFKCQNYISDWNLRYTRYYFFLYILKDIETSSLSFMHLNHK